MFEVFIYTGSTGAFVSRKYYPSIGEAVAAAKAAISSGQIAKVSRVEAVITG